MMSLPSRISCEPEIPVTEPADSRTIRIDQVPSAPCGELYDRLIWDGATVADLIELERNVLPFAVPLDVALSVFRSVHAPPGALYSTCHDNGRYLSFCEYSSEMKP